MSKRLAFLDYSEIGRGSGKNREIRINGDYYSPAGSSVHTISLRCKPDPTSPPISPTSKFLYTLKDGDDLELATGDFPLFEGNCNMNDVTFHNGDKDDKNHVTNSFGGKIWTNGITV